VTDSFQRYLRAKRTVDDRALDRRLVDDLRARLVQRADAIDGPLRVLDAGAGIGTMLARAIEWDLLPAGDIRYTAVDIDANSIDALSDFLAGWAEGHDCSVSGADPLVVEDSERRVTVEPVVADALAYAADHPASHDLLVGVALLDIVDRSALVTLLGAVAPDGLYYFPITFDGATRFRPAHPADRAVESYYHEHMDTKPGGDSRAGGAVLARLQDLGGSTLIGVAGSDWVVRPVDGAYPAGEAYFLRFILDTVEGAVDEVTDGAFDDLDDWLATRRQQVDRGELLYTTHQLDFLGRVDDPDVFGDG